MCVYVCVSVYWHIYNKRLTVVCKLCKVLIRIMPVIWHVSHSFSLVEKFSIKILTLVFMYLVGINFSIYMSKAVLIKEEGRGKITKDVSASLSH